MMRAVVFKGPHVVAVEDRPVPRIQDAGDMIVRVGYSALCGR
jgi:threonine dehydrogenase-like Zn-dependent dehydrogenase